jgi:hypothetical protein
MVVQVQPRGSLVSLCFNFGKTVADRSKNTVFSSEVHPVPGCNYRPSDYHARVYPWTGRTGQLQSVS